MSARLGVAQRSHVRPPQHRSSHWIDEAVCFDSAIDFHSEDPMEIADAKLMCASCDVAYACLSHALERGEPGVWGGTTDAERAELMRPKAAAR